MRRRIDIACWALALAVVVAHFGQHVQQERAARTAVQARQAEACARAAANAHRLHRELRYPLGDYPVRPRPLGLAHGTYPRHLLRDGDPALDPFAARDRLNF